MHPLILASTSPFRRELLARLRLPFEVVSPTYEEDELPGVPPPARALRHALGKGRSVASRLPERIVIGCDQVADLGGRCLGKAGGSRSAVEQLRAMSGRWVVFHTGLALLQGGREETALETYRVKLRNLSLAEIEAYVAVERPFQSAGSFQIEGLGIALMESLEGRDYTSLIGLPLIALADLLARFGVSVLGEAARLRSSGVAFSGRRG